MLGSSISRSTITCENSTWQLNKTSRIDTEVSFEGAHPLNGALRREG